MIRKFLSRIGRRLGPEPIDSRFMQGASGALFSLPELLTRSREQNEAIIRSLCFGAYLGGTTALCRVLGRYKMLVDTDDLGVSVHLMAEGSWEMWHTEVTAQLLKPGMKAIDVGANVGYFSVLMSELVGEAGSVHAFEPNPVIAARLRNSLAINGFADRATVYDFALGDRDGTARLYIPERAPGGAHVLHDMSDLPGTDIRIRRFDAVPELADADFIKIDVEGAEQAVWHGMKGLLDSGRPMTIVLEFTAERYDDSGGFVDEILASGFSLSLIHLDQGILPTDRAALLSKPMEEQLVLLRR